MKIKYFALIALLLFVISLSESVAQQSIKKDSVKINNFLLKYELFESSLNVILKDTINHISIENDITDFSGIISDKLYDFDVIAQPNGFILKYTEKYIGYSYVIIFHVFKKYNNQFYYSKEYSATDGRNSSFLAGDLVSNIVKFQDYVPKSDNNRESKLESYSGYQDYDLYGEDKYKEPEPILPMYEKKISSFSKLKQTDSLKVYCDYFILDRWLSGSYCISKNQVAINNIGYYLEKNQLYDESVYVLNKLLEYFPNRTVAYINLGDAYWGLKENYKAKQAYQKYIELMKASGKECKIPKRVFERTK